MASKRRLPNAEPRDKTAGPSLAAMLVMAALLLIGCSGGGTEDDAEPISEAPALVQEVEELRARVGELEEQLEAKNDEIRRLRTRAVLAEAAVEDALDEIEQDTSPVRRREDPGEFAWNVNPASVYPIEVLAIDAKEIRRSDHYLTFAWKVVVRNVDHQPQAVDIEIQFMDRDGLAIDDVSVDLKLGSQESRTLSDQKVIARPGADSVESLRPLVKLQ